MTDAERIAELQGERDAAYARITELEEEVRRLNEFFTKSASLRALRERDVEAIIRACM